MTTPQGSSDHEALTAECVAQVGAALSDDRTALIREMYERLSR